MIVPASLWGETKSVTLSDGTVIVVRHIGGVDNPFAVDGINGRYLRAFNAARIRARKEVAALGADAVEVVFGRADARLPARDEHDQPTEGTRPATDKDAIERIAGDDAELGAAYARLVRDRIVLGTTGGQALYERLHAAGGPRLLVEADAAVAAFNRSLGAETKNG